MKKYILFFLFLNIAQCLSAQEIKILEVKPLEHSLKARTAQVRDNNGELCALIEVAAPKLDGLSFEENRYVGEVKFADGVYSMFVPAGTKRIGFRHNDFMPGNIEFAAFDLSIESGMVYSVGLHRMDVAAEYQYLVLNVTPSDAVVELDGRVQQTSEGTVSAFVQVGTSHHYRISAVGMVVEEGDVTVMSAEQKTEVNVTLRDYSSRVRIVAVNGADIYVNDRLVGSGAWEGSLAPGTFKVEARIGGRVVSSEACTVEEESQDVQEFVLMVFYGSLNITSVQPKVSVSFDGQDFGVTPVFKPRIIVGNHSIVARKEGFDTEAKIVVVERDKVTDVSFDLKQDIDVQHEAKKMEKQNMKEIQPEVEMESSKNEREHRTTEKQSVREFEARLRAEGEALRVAEAERKAKEEQDRLNLETQLQAEGEALRAAEAERKAKEKKESSKNEREQRAAEKQSHREFEARLRAEGEALRAAEAERKAKEGIQ